MILNRPGVVAVYLTGKPAKGVDLKTLHLQLSVQYLKMAMLKIK